VGELELGSILGLDDAAAGGGGGGTRRPSRALSYTFNAVQLSALWRKNRGMSYRGVKTICEGHIRSLS